MNRPRARSLTAWIASLAILLGALVPLLAQAGYRLTGDRVWLQVCTANGVRDIVVDPSSSPTGDQTAAASGRCAWCTLQATIGMPPGDSRLPVVPSKGSASSLPAETGVLPLMPAWTPAHPRAPPARAPLQPQYG